MPSPASITYKVNNIEQAIYFHSVISEQHVAQTQITKIPVQTGFEISSHAIRKNRSVVLEGIFTNNLVEGSGMVEYSKHNNTKAMFKALENLVQSAHLCKVVTNLGIYNPVVFTSFSTSQKEGYMDSMVFTIKGEEVQIASLVSATAPKALSFTKLSYADKEDLKERWEEAGIPFSYQNDIRKATVELGEDFIIETNDIIGRPQTCTFECKAFEPDTGNYSYAQHSSLLDIYDDPSKIKNRSLGNTEKVNTLTGGLLGASKCLVGKVEDHLINVVEEELDDLLETAVGNMNKSIHGVLENISTLGGGGILQPILGFAVDCLILEIEKDLDIDLGVYTTNKINKATEGLSKVFETFDSSMNSSVESLKEYGEEGERVGEFTGRSFKKTKATIFKVVGSTSSSRSRLTN